MAGKKRRSNIKDTRGGARKGAGRPAGVGITHDRLQSMLNKAEEWAKDHDGHTVDDFLLSVIFGEQDAGWKMTMRDRLTAAKIWKDYTMAKVQEKNVNIKETRGPVIMLPPLKPDPAKLIPEKS